MQTIWHGPELDHLDIKPDLYTTASAGMMA
jgi:hypothetical protein